MPSRLLTANDFRFFDSGLALRNPRLWGEGASSCASDATKFESWKQNPMVEWRSRYKGYGVMVYWHVETNAVCIYSQLKSLFNAIRWI
jgi:TnpA family transposase